MILITGASSGIGEACAMTFAALGRELILVARRQDRLKEISSRIQREHSIPPVTFQLDVQDSRAIDSLIRAHEDLFSKVTVLVNNAGLAKGFGPIQEGKLE